MQPAPPTTYSVWLLITRSWIRQAEGMPTHAAATRLAQRLAQRRRAQSWLVLADGAGEPVA